MDETAIKRVMPHDTLAEQSVIGSMLMSQEAIVEASEILSKDDFYGKQYGVLFQAITELYNAGKTVDIVTLRNHLQEMNAPEEISSPDVLRDAAAAVPSSAGVRNYSNIVKEKAILRKLIRVAETIENASYAGHDTLESILDNTEKMVYDVIQHRTTQDFQPIDKIAIEALEKINIASQTKGNVTGVATGFSDLDYMTAGLQPSDLILIAARPSMGKTAFVLNIIQHMCFKQELCVAMFSLEMSREQLFNRLLSQESKVNSKSIRNGNMNEREWDSIVESAGIIGKSKLIIDDTPGISIGELKSKCRKYKMDHQIRAIFIDYLQLMAGNSRSESRQQEISEISRSLKSLARELNVPVIALSQLSRAVEKRDDHRPMLSDLRESGAIEQDADVVMFLYRDSYYNKDTANKDIAEVNIAKQRNGPTGTIQLIWMEDYTKFANKAKE
ncbi:MAG: replicative DNA helicase [Lachnospiraceae bacterium]|nr:replicative DNA helicase [Lachnospiraceae bacterium]MCR5267160.1 replicative DNA helicase [Lachnospiraceae bacterium]